MVLALLAGGGTWLVWAGGAHRGPFVEAIANLAGAPAVHFRNDGIDVRTTATGEFTGSVTIEGDRVGVLGVGGRSFVSPAEGSNPSWLPGDLPAGLGSRWVTGSDAVLRPLLEHLRAPAVLADLLRAEVDQASSLPSRRDPELLLDGVPAWKAITPNGELYVSREQPHRVLRFIPTGVALKAATRPLGPTEGQPRARPTGFDGYAGGIDLDPLGGSDVDDTFDELKEQARRLDTAVDVSITIELPPTAQVSCGPGGCSYATAVANRVTATGTITGGAVNTALTATFAVNGRAAGGCSANVVMAPNSSGEISCVSPASGAVFATVQQQQSAAAQARANACRCRVPWQVHSIGSGYVVAIANVNVTQIIRDLDERQRLVSQGCSFDGATPVLMADGTHKPIQDVRVGDQVLAADPTAGTTRARSVLRLHRHLDSGLLDLTVTDPTGARHVISTTGDHPFWDDTRHRWTEASALAVGTRLRDSDGDDTTAVLVAASTGRPGSATLHNLTIAGDHTYHVLAGGTAVLVHNSWCTDEERAEDVESIANGHADAKHRQDFPGLTRYDLQRLVRDAILNPARVKDLSSGRRAFLGKDGTTIVIHDPLHPDGGTVFRRAPATLDEYWDGL